MERGTAPTWMVFVDVRVPSLFSVNSVIDLDPSFPTYMYFPLVSIVKKNGFVPAEPDVPLFGVRSPVLLMSKIEIVVDVKFATYRNFPVGSTTLATGFFNGVVVFPYGDFCNALSTPPGRMENPETVFAAKFGAYKKVAEGLIATDATPLAT